MKQGWPCGENRILRIDCTSVSYLIELSDLLSGFFVLPLIPAAVGFESPA